MPQHKGPRLEGFIEDYIAFLTAKITHPETKNADKPLLQGRIDGLTYALALDRGEIPPRNIAAKPETSAMLLNTGIQQISDAVAYAEEKASADIATQAARDALKIDHERDDISFNPPPPTIPLAEKAFPHIKSIKHIDKRNVKRSDIDRLFTKQAEKERRKARKGK